MAIWIAFMFSILIHNNDFFPSKLAASDTKRTHGVGKQFYLDIVRPISYSTNHIFMILS